MHQRPTLAQKCSSVIASLERLIVCTLKLIGGINLVAAEDRDGSTAVCKLNHLIVFDLEGL
jgi:hypothetical protein